MNATIAARLRDFATTYRILHRGHGGSGPSVLDLADRIEAGNGSPADFARANTLIGDVEPTCTSAFCLCGQPKG